MPSIVGGDAIRGSVGVFVVFGQVIALGLGIAGHGHVSPGGRVDGVGPEPLGGWGFIFQVPLRLRSPAA